MSLSKSGLIDAIASKAGITKKLSGEVLEATLDTITAELKKGGEITLTGFGSFKVSERKARNGINPQTKAPIKIAAKKSPKFTPGKTLKEVVAGLKKK